VNRLSCLRAPPLTQRRSRSESPRPDVAIMTDARLESDEKVVTILGKTGASVAKKLKKNKHQKEEERREMDRVLGPAPILVE